MIEDAPIVKDTRRVRTLISHRFGNDLDRYLTYLRETAPHPKPAAKNQVRETGTGYSTSPQSTF